jgi:predicted small metal-binding protein
MLAGADNDELMRRGREHADKDHAGDGITDDSIRDHVTANARDAAVA